MRAPHPREAAFGRYELLCLLATGGMASVHLARVEGIGGFEKLLVIKRILPHVAKDRSFIEMFLDEARIAATLDHANVAHVFDVGLVEGDVFLAMEFLHGYDLRSIVRSIDGPLPLDPAVAIGVGVCAGLHYAHEKRGLGGQLLGLVHRDVSPSNVVVTYDGSVKVIDFGIAKATNRSTETGSGILKGKPGYMSPEQCLGETIDRRSDVFCVGIMLYELTTGTRLFGPRGAEYAQLQAIVEAKFPPPSTLLSGYPPGLEPIVLKALRKDPAERYQTALELQGALEAFARASRLDGSPTQLAKFMAETFQDELEGWRAAERSGVSLAEHVVKSGQGGRASVGRFATVKGAASEAATETESPEGRSGINQYASTELVAAQPSVPSVDGKKTDSAPSGVTSMSRPPGEVTTRIPVSATRQEESRGDAVTQRGTRTRRTVAALSALAVALGVGIAVRYGPRHSSLPPAPSSVAAPAPTPITSLPLPSSANREALAAYVEAVQAMRDGAGHTARVKFARATELDPMLAAAHLRATYFLAEEDDRLGRASYERARELRTLLTKRDQEFLDALEPAVARTPTDPAEATRRFVTLSQRYPGDAEIAQYLASVQGLQGHDVESVVSAKRAIQIDPDFVVAQALLGEEQAYLGDFDGALETLNRCIASTGAATTCASTSDNVLSQRGQCEAMAAVEARVRASSPEGQFGYNGTAEAALARGEPLALVREILGKQPNAREPLAGRRIALRLAVVAGDFTAAEAEARALAKAAAGETAMYWPMFAATWLSDIFAETGRTREAGEVARAVLGAAAGWDPVGRVDDDGISRDRTPSLLAQERRASLLSRDEMVRKRQAWLEGWSTKAPHLRGYLWLEAYGDSVDTAEDAREALEALPLHGGVPPFRPNTTISVGRVYWLAGDLDAAIPVLRSEAHSCTAYRWPFEHVRANYMLGRALAAKGDTVGACAAYQEVMARWGQARPRSVTAEEAKAQMRALGCAAP